jgi:hypothetical protein
MKDLGIIAGTGRSHGEGHPPGTVPCEDSCYKLAPYPGHPGPRAGPAQTGGGMSRPYAALFALGLVLAGPAWAQGAPQPGMSSMQSGQVVRIRTSAGQLLQGRYTATDALLRSTDQEVPLGGTAIDSVWVRGTRAKSGALIGGLVLGAASAVFWSEMCNIASEGHGCDETGSVVGLTLAGAAAGAGLGALVGLAVPTWRLSYARPGPSVRLSAVSLDRVGLIATVPF